MFFPANGVPLSDPVSGNPLLPSTVLKGLYLGATGRGDGSYGKVQFFRDNNNYNNVAYTQGNGLNLSASGPYYSTVTIGLNINIWNWGYAGENTATLLHELGHAMNILAAGFGSQNSFAGDSFSDSASVRNTTLVRNNCTRGLTF